LNWSDGFLAFLQAVGQILTAGVAITAFSLLLFSFAFNLKDRVIRSFTVILICVCIVFSTEAIGSTAIDKWAIELWNRLEWVGIIFIPAAYMHFSDALLTTTGRPSQGKRRLLVWLLYVLSLLMVALLPTNIFIGPININPGGLPFFSRTWLTNLFLLYFLLILVLSWFNLIRAFQRTTTQTSRRRMGYLVVSAAAPALGSFPFLIFNVNFPLFHPIIFWAILGMVYLSVGTLLVVMAYSVAFFGVSWTDRVVKSRLFKWLMRGPATASVTLGLSTLVRRSGDILGIDYPAIAPIVMVLTILVCEYFITLLAPLAERFLFYGNDSNDLAVLKKLEDRLLTRNDLRQFLEMIITAICDRLQAKGGYVVAYNSGGLELVVTSGVTRFNENETSDELKEIVSRDELLPDIFAWGDDHLIPLTENGRRKPKELIGLIGISGVSNSSWDQEQLLSVQMLAKRAAMALHDRMLQKQIFDTMENLTPQVDLIQRLRAKGSFDGNTLLEEPETNSGDLAQWVRDALNHYWGGPKFSTSPLMKLKIVKDAVEEHEGNYPNALRSVLKHAIGQVKPEGDRRFTAEWILYNILEMKFVEGRKVREIASRLAMSEADLYRKQRIAIEVVAKAIMEMEETARNHNG
jgi:hypothetical protein